MTAKRRTQTEMARDRLAKAEAKVRDLDARLAEAIAEGGRLANALAEAEKMRDYHAAHPLLQEEPDESEES